MNIKIEKGLARGEIFAPPSKSYAHRLLIAGALAGKSSIDGIIGSEDMNATLDCISALGVDYRKNGKKVEIIGTDFLNGTRVFDCHESGSTLRFFIPVALALGNNATFVGTKRLFERGIEIYEEIFSRQGIEFKKQETKIEINGKLMPDTFYVRGNVSSQYITGLLFALPLLNGDSKIVITTELESSAYVDITLDALKQFGIEILRENNELYIKGNQKYLPKNLTVEGDASNGAFLDAFNILGGDVSVLGLKNDTLQSDIAYKKHFLALENGTPTIDISNTPDLGPILFAIAGAKNGARFVGTKRLKIKESPRDLAMAEELKKFGIDTEIYENEVVIKKSTIHAPSEVLSGHNDHRIVMSLAVLCTLFGGTISGSLAVNKSYPTFFDDLRSLGISWEAKNEDN